MVVMYQQVITHGHHAQQLAISAVTLYRKTGMMMVQRLMGIPLQVPAAVNIVGQTCHHTPQESNVKHAIRKTERH